MEVRIANDKFCLTPSLRDHLDRELQFSFSGVHNNILLVTVRLRDLNGPRGGSDMMCRIVVTISGCPDIVIKEVHEDMYTAINFAAQRAAHRTERLLLQRRQARKREHVFISRLQPEIRTV